MYKRKLCLYVVIFGGIVVYFRLFILVLQTVPIIMRRREESSTSTQEMKFMVDNYGAKVDKVISSADNPSVLTDIQQEKDKLGYLMNMIDNLEARTVMAPLPACLMLGKVGLMYVPKNPPSVSMKHIEKRLPFVKEGGRWSPKTCRSKKVAIVVPYRDRESHLILFLLHMHRFLRWQLLDYRIYIIEQATQISFNRGMLMNIGFQEAMKREKYDCVIFHDVDLLPEDDRNDYGCPSSPRHMSTAVDTMDYKLMYKKIFGGVEAFWPEHFQSINGFPNRYWGWGGEDDDLYVRVTDRKYLGLTRPAYQIGRYTMINHKKSTDKNPERHRMLGESKQYIETDGLNTLKYEIAHEKNFTLYTLIAVNIKPDPTESSNSWWR